MPQFTLIHLLFQGLPETIAMAVFVLTFSNFKLNWRLVLFLGLIQVFTTYFIRMLPLPFGMHTIILVITLSAYVKVATKISLYKALQGSALCIVILALVEISVDWLLFSFLGISFEEAMTNEALWILLGWPQILVLLGLTWLKIRSRKTQNSVSF